jgi:hypothetical protein
MFTFGLAAHMSLAYSAEAIPQESSGSWSGAASAAGRTATLANAALQAK